MEKLIDSIRGKGKVFKDDKPVLDVNYAIRIYQEMLQTRDEVIPGMKRFEGQLDTKEPQEISRLMMAPGDNEYVLKLEDGRRLKFLFSSNDGTIQATGGF